MDELEALLSDAGKRFEPEIQRRLHGLLGGILRAYLPQAWVFLTDAGVASLRVDAAGTVSAAAGAADPADVTIEVSFDRLARALRTREPDPGGPGAVKVTAHTAKGKAAFDYLRSRLGL